MATLGVFTCTSLNGCRDPASRIYTNIYMCMHAHTYACLYACSQCVKQSKIKPTCVKWTTAHRNSRELAGKEWVELVTFLRIIMLTWNFSEKY